MERPKQATAAGLGPVLAVLISAAGASADGGGDGAPWEQAEQPIVALAVQLADGVVDPALAAAAVAGSGLVPVGVEPFHTDGWHRVALDTAVDASTLRTPVEVVAAHPTVEFATPLWSTVDGGWAAPTADLLVRLADPAAVSLADVAPDLTALASRVADLDGVWRAGLGALAAPTGFDVLDRADELRRDPAVRWVEPDALATGSSAQFGPIVEPGDPLYFAQWAHDNGFQAPGGFDVDLDTPAAWAFTKGSVEAPVLVIDVGVDLAHPELIVALGADFTGQDGGGGPVGPCDKHGTAVAGCIGAQHDNGIGIAGAAPDAPLFSARCFIADASCTGTWSTQYAWTAEALAWGTAQGARVSVNSNFHHLSSSIITDAYAQARVGGMVHFSSAGNTSGSVTWPASLADVHAITAVTAYGTLAPFSCNGPEAGFTAPGVSVWSTDIVGVGGFVAGDVSMVSGTSYAAPYAASVAALVLAVVPALSPDQVDQVLRATAGDLGALGHDPKFGHGLPRAGRAVRHALGLLPLLAATPATLALDVGGTQTLALEGGPAVAGQPYLVVGGASGPALAPGGEGIGTLPMALDAYTSFSVALANQAPFVDTFGVLDAAGQATAKLVLPPASDPGLAGLELLHAYLVFTPTFDGFDGPASEPAALELVTTAGP